jgi:hypothetical protein
MGLVGGQDQFTRSLGVFEHLNACGFEQRQGFVKDTSFGQSKRDQISSPARASPDARINPYVT